MPANARQTGKYPDMSKCVRANVSIRANVRTEWFSYGQMCETPIGKLKLPYGITQYYMPCLDPSLTCQYSILPPRRDGRLSWLVLVIFLEENSVHRDGFPHKAWAAQKKIWSWGNEGRRGKRKSTESNKFFVGGPMSTLFQLLLHLKDVAGGPRAEVLVGRSGAYTFHFWTNLPDFNIWKRKQITDNLCCFRKWRLLILRLHDQANIKQSSNKHRANIEQI